ncbi:NADPH:quinone oxidoreductase family protein [Microbacterium sp. RD1]|uniref:NADPH:quinone oxidoreductase family protein n=1 Tax=Microbacterium sp. RD1 TaxID=3457313 RepID=UPI003FA5C106
MRAVRVASYHGPGAVEVGQEPSPEPAADEVLISVRAAGIAFPDVLHTRGAYQVRFEPPFVLGGECAGVVVSAPEGSRFREGDRVAAVMLRGAFAEMVAVPEFLVQPLPTELSFEEGACLPVNYLTAEYTLGARGRLVPDEVVLVHGAAGGIGTAMVQVAVARGARVIAVTSSPEKAEIARTAGAHHVVAVDEFREQAQLLTDGRGVDMVVDPVGGDRFTDSLRTLRPRTGRLMVVGFAGGSIPTVKVNRLLLTNTDVRGVGWGDPAFRVPGFVSEQWRALMPLLREHRIAPPLIDSRPLDSAADALTAIDERHVLGKLVLIP